MKNNKMTKDTVSEGFSVVMALVDLIPVVFFGLSAVRVGRLFQSALFVTGALICLLSGVVKVLWKLIAAVSRRNIWPMFVQMRIFMPVGFLLLLAALIAGRAKLCSAAILAGICGFPACVFFALGALGMVCMCVFARRLDSSDPRELARAGRQRSGADLHLYRPAAGVNQSLCMALDKLMPYITISYFFGAAAPCYNKKLDKTSPLEKECYTT